MIIDDDVTTPVVDDTPVVSEAEEVTATEAETDPSLEGADELTQEELEEIERNGKKYKIPKELKGEFLMQQDYTKKTQEAAELRKAAEAQKATLEQRERELSQDVEERAALHALSKTIEQYEQINWNALEQQNPQLAASKYRELQEMRNAAQRLAFGLSQKQQQRAQESERERATRLQERDAVLAREIPNWSKATESKVKEFGIAQGLTTDEVENIHDPRFVKILHSAWIGQQLQAKAKAEAAKAKTAEEPEPKPTPTVGARKGASPSGLDDRLPIDEWMRRRNKQVAARGG